MNYTSQVIVQLHEPLNPRLTELATRLILYALSTPTTQASILRTLLRRAFDRQRSGVGHRCIPHCQEGKRTLAKLQRAKSYGSQLATFSCLPQYQAIRNWCCLA
jgi:hypothetical protein